MGRQLNTHVWVHQDTGEPVLYGPGVDVPDGVAELITNPKVWADGAPAPAVVPAIVTDNPVPAGGSGGVFDPAEHSVVEVLAYLEGLSDDEADEYVRVTEAEAAGKARKGILEA